MSRMKYKHITPRKSHRKQKHHNSRRINQRGGSYIEKYNWHPVSASKKIIDSIGSSYIWNSKYLNITAMDNDINTHLKDFCMDNNLLEIYEFIQENVDNKFLLNEAHYNGISSINENKINDLEKFKRMVSNYGEYLKCISDITKIITLDFVDKFLDYKESEGNNELYDWENTIDDEVENTISYIIQSFKIQT